MSKKTANTNVPEPTEGVTELVITPAAPANDKPVQIDAKTLNLLGSVIEVAFFDTGAVRFGKTDGVKEYVTLKHFGEILGFLNGTKYVLDGKYPQLVKGYHAKFTDTDYREFEEAAYVNFDTLRNLDVAEMLAKAGIKPEGHGWSALKIVRNVLYPQYHVRPLLSKDLVEAAQLARMEKEALEGNPNPAIPQLSAEDLIPWKKNNEHAWNQFNLHEGLDLILDIVAGVRCVLVAYKPQPGFEAKAGILKSKLDLLWDTREARQEDTAKGILKAQTQDTVNKTAWMVNHVPVVAAKVEMAAPVAAKGIQVFVLRDEHLEPTTVTYEKLVRASVTLYFAGEPTPRNPFMRNVEAVRAVVSTFVKGQGFDIVVKKFAA